MLKSVLKICFNLIFLFALTGCITFKKDGEKWPLPSEAEIKPVKISSIKEVDIKQDGYYLEREDAINLADNIDELKAYTEKLEILIRTMKKFYGAR